MKLSADSAQENQVFQYCEYFKPMFTFLECERHQNMSYVDRSDHDRSSRNTILSTCTIDVM